MTNSIEEIIAHTHDIDARYRLLQVNFEISEATNFLRGRKLTNFLEIGSYSGGTFACWASVIGGKKLSIDLTPREVDAARRDRQWEEDFENVHIYHGDSHTVNALQWATQVLNGEKVDFLFIDGDHSEHGCRHDYEMYKHLVTDRGIIGFHDIVASDKHHSEGCYVDKVWEGLRHPTMNMVEFRGNRQWGGIGFLVKGSYPDTYESGDPYP